MRTSENGCVSLLYGTGEDFGIHFFGTTHFGVFEFLGLWGGLRLHPILGGGLWGGILAVKLSLVGLWGF